MTNTLKIGILLGLLSTSLFAQSTVQWGSKIIGVSSELSGFGPSYTAKQALGKPTRFPVFGKTGGGWIPAVADNSAPDWIHVGYEKPTPIQQIIVAENENAGCITRIDAFDEQGGEHNVYENANPQTGAPFGRWMYVFIPRTTYNVSALKVTLNTSLVTGTNAIDAIGIADSRDSVKLSINLAKGLETAGPIEDLGPVINSNFDELLPVISSDNKTLYFTRQNHPENIAPITNQDVWYSTIMPDGSFSPAKNLGAPINNTDNSAALAITPDGQSMLVLNIYKPDGTMGVGVSMTKWDGAKWGMPEKQNITNFYNRSPYGEYSLSVSGKILVATMQRDDGFGSKDLHVCFLQEDGSWSEPKNLGAVLNTADSEATPFLAADDKTLYFSTNGHPGYGRNDVFMTKRLDDTWQNWSEPLNLGPELNTPNWDAYYTFTANGEYVYFVSSNTAHGGDIYRKKLPASLRPAPVVMVSGKVFDLKTKQPLHAQIKYDDLTTGTNAGFAQSDKLTFEYKIVLQSGRQYSFMAETENYYPVSENLDLTKINQFTEIKRDLYLAPIEKGMAIRLNNLFFDFNKSELKKESEQELKRLVALLNEYPNMKIEIAGHTDNVGTDETNIPLSNRRAQAVMTWLTKNSIGQTRLTSKGYGKSKPVATGNSEEARRLNRRVEFLITEL